MLLNLIDVKAHRIKLSGVVQPVTFWLSHQNINLDGLKVAEPDLLENPTGRAQTCLV